MTKILKRKISRSYKRIFKNPIYKFFVFLNKKGNKHRCNICNNTFSEFTKYHGGNKNVPNFRIKLEMVDSNRDTFGCPYCMSFDRERHLFMFFEKMGFWNELPHMEILHFAPEKNLSNKIETCRPLKYLKADINPSDASVIKIDATRIPYKDNSFDLLICNHVLEHIPDYLSAISEFYRVLRPKGTAILQTPYSKLLSCNFEDDNINSDELREYFYGEKDHFRIFSEQQLLRNLEDAGFKLKIEHHGDYFNEFQSFYFGVCPEEDLIQVVKEK